MDLKAIISISGMSGLYKIVAQSKGGVIVESLADKKRTAISSAHRISSLEEISVFCKGENVKLEDILTKMKENPPANVSNPKEIREYLQSIVPDMDGEKVYDSDIKKMVSWFSLLKDSPEYWVEKKEEEKVEGEEKAGTQPVHPEKPHHIPKGTAKANSHGASTMRSVIPQKRGGG